MSRPLRLKALVKTSDLAVTITDTVNLPENGHVDAQVSAPAFETSTVKDAKPTEADVMPSHPDPSIPAYLSEARHPEGVQETAQKGAQPEDAVLSCT